MSRYIHYIFLALPGTRNLGVSVPYIHPKCEVPLIVQKTVRVLSLCIFVCLDSVKSSVDFILIYQLCVTMYEAKVCVYVVSLPAPDNHRHYWPRIRQNQITGSNELRGQYTTITRHIGCFGLDWPLYLTDDEFSSRFEKCDLPFGQCYLKRSSEIGDG